MQSASGVVAIDIATWKRIGRFSLGLIATVIILVALFGWR